MEERFGRLIKMKGTVKFFDNVKKYGFIKPEDKQEEDHFFHESNIKGNYTPEEGDEVEFDSELEEKGFQALNVKKIKD